MIEKAILISFLLGVIEACFGAWKDTLFEEFKIVTFIRSPIVVVLSCFILLVIFPKEENFLLIAIASISLERLIIEGYKAVIRKPPSKFKSATKDRGWLWRAFSK